MRFVDLELGSGIVRPVNPDQVAYIRMKGDAVWLVFGAAGGGGLHEFSVKGTVAEVRALLERPQCAADAIAPSADDTAASASDRSAARRAKSAKAPGASG